jgi:hypothetical protein
MCDTKIVKAGNKKCGVIFTNVGPSLFYLTTLLIAKIIYSVSDGVMNDTGHWWKCWENVMPQCHFVHCKSHMNWPGIEPDEKPATNRLSCGTTCLSFVTNQPTNQLTRNGLLKMAKFIFYPLPFVCLVL